MFVHQTLGSVPDPEERDTFKEVIKADLKKVRRFLRTVNRVVRQEIICPLFNGRHEYYKHHSEFKLNQKCLLCQKETKGWDLTPRKLLRGPWM